MSTKTLERTRQSLHGLAELVLAGPQYAVNQSIRLRATPGGFGTATLPDLRVDGLDLVAPAGRVPLSGTFSDLARAAGVEARDLRDVYPDGSGLTKADFLHVDSDAAAVIAEAFAQGDAAMRVFAPDQEPVLWPEHFDLGISWDEVNYGVSPGDSHLLEPYAYVGPWSPREGTFWNTPFGAARPLTELPDVDTLVGFFREGARQAGSAPTPSS